MSTRPRFAIIGAGNGGLATAADLTLRGHHVVAMYNRTFDRLRPVVERGGIEAVGLRSGFARIDNVTDDIGKAVRDADVILVVMPAFGQAWVAEKLVPYLRDGQIVLLAAGYLGTLEVQRIWRECGLKAKVFLAEAQGLFYGGRQAGPAKVHIINVRSRLPTAALPAGDTGHVLDVLKDAFPQLHPAADVLDVGITNINIPEHVPLCVLNFARWQKEGATAHIPDWKTPPVVRLANLIDDERRAVARAYGVSDATLDELRRGTYVGERQEMRQSSEEVPETAGVLPRRYITEDVPMGFVPLYQLAQVAGVTTPVLRLMIDLSSVLLETDFMSEGRTLTKLGLAGMSVEQIKARVR